MSESRWFERENEKYAGFPLSRLPEYEVKLEFHVACKRIEELLIAYDQRGKEIEELKGRLIVSELREVSAASRMLDATNKLAVLQAAIRRSDVVSLVRGDEQVTQVYAVPVSALTALASRESDWIEEEHNWFWNSSRGGIAKEADGKWYYYHKDSEERDEVAFDTLQEAIAHANKQFT